MICLLRRTPASGVVVLVSSAVCDFRSVQPAVLLNGVALSRQAGCFSRREASSCASMVRVVEASRVENAKSFYVIRSSGVQFL